MKLGRREVLIGGVAIVVIAFFLCFFVYLPLGSRIRKAGRELKVIEGELEMVKGTIETVGSHGKRSLPTQEEISIAIDELTRRGRDLGINFISISPQKIEEIQDLPYGFLPIRMELESGYEDLGRFLGALEGLEESVVTIGGFEIERDERILPKVRTKLEAKMYLMSAESGEE